MGERGLSDSLDAGDDTDAAVALNASDIVAAYWKGAKAAEFPRQKAPFPLRNQSSTFIAPSDEGAMTQVPIRPFYESDLTAVNNSPHQKALFSGRFLNGHFAAP
jgi:hypothetical protein